MRRTLLLAALAAAAAGCDRLTSDFRLSGTIELSAPLRERAPKSGAVLFIVVKNAGGVPVAVHRIVNPEFPASFRLGPQDLLVPALPRQEALTVELEMNTHGAAGKPRPGDLVGGSPGVVRPGAGDLRLLIDKQL